MGRGGRNAATQTWPVGDACGEQHFGNALSMRAGPFVVSAWCLRTRHSPAGCPLLRKDVRFFSDAVR